MTHKTFPNVVELDAIAWKILEALQRSSGNQTLVLHVEKIDRVCLVFGGFRDWFIGRKCATGSRNEFGHRSTCSGVWPAPNGRKAEH